MSSSSDNWILSVLNDKGVEEQIGEIQVSPALRLTSSQSHSLLVSTYTREPSILRADSSYERHMIQSTHPTEPAANPAVSNKPHYSKQLTSFIAYLRDRKKAAVVKVDGRELYILSTDSTSTPSTFLHIPTLYLIEQPKGLQPIFQTSNPPLPLPLPPTSLLANLSNRLGDSGTGGRGRVSEKAKIETVVGYFKDLEAKIRQRLDIFSTDPELNELRLDPMDKDQRYVVHDVVTDYPHLLSTAIGDYDERHVVVYRKGFQPIGVDVSSLHPSEYRKNLPKKRNGGMGVGGMGVGGMGVGGVGGMGVSVTKVGLVKRDRRTTEEVQLEIKRRKGL